MREPSDADRLRAEYDALLYAVSHDLRAPLRAIDGFTRIIEEEGWNAESPQHLRVIRDNVDRMRLMMEGLLEMSRKSRDAMTVKPIDMVQAAAGALEELRRTGRGGDVEVVIGPLAPCHGHPPFIACLWEVLLDNACKFGARHVTVRCDREGDENVYRVIDDGSGFDPKYAGRLFTPFQRLHDGTVPGLGMGLALARLLVWRHEGRIEAAAAPGAGATFSFTIPTLV